MVASSKGPEQGNQSQHQLGGQRTPRIVQGIPIVPGPPHLEQCAHAIPVRVLSFSPPSFLFAHSLSYCAADCRMLPTTAAPVTFLFLTT